MLLLICCCRAARASNPIITVLLLLLLLRMMMMLLGEVASILLVDPLVVILSGLPHEAAAIAIVGVGVSRRILAFFQVGYGPMMLVKLLLVKLIMLPTAANTTVLLHQLLCC